MLDYGFDPQNCLICDTRGVIYEGREEGKANPYKARFAVKTEKRTLADAVKGADMLVGLSIQGAFTGEMLKSMNKDPVVFALANPEPEIRPEQMYEVRDDVIAATGRSDFPN
jgi:malate dehydrogenase (oxaloacetate-decarboxylating)(NADP+)